MHSFWVKDMLEDIQGDYHIKNCVTKRLCLKILVSVAVENLAEASIREEVRSYVVSALIGQLLRYAPYDWRGFVDFRLAPPRDFTFQDQSQSPLTRD